MIHNVLAEREFTPPGMVFSVSAVMLERIDDYRKTLQGHYEIDSLRRQDKARSRIMEIVEMPDRLAQDLILFMRQNSGVIPKRCRRREFAALTDEEARQIETIYRDVFESCS